MKIARATPRWAVPLKKPRRYKGAKGGRSGGKSHFLGEETVIDMVKNPDLKVVGIREVQKSIRYSVKSLIEGKIEKFGLEDLFDSQRDVIYRKGGKGLMIFQGMQDHTADSIKSLEDFDVGLVEEANGLSKRSITLLTPTLRKEGSELRFAWNPDQEDDAVDAFFRENEGDPDFLCVHVNVTDNPFISDTGYKEYVRAKKLAQRSPADWTLFEHVWLGGYNVLSEAIVFAGCWVEEGFEPDFGWDGPYYGCDFGFSQDPTVFVEYWIYNNTLYIRRDCSQVGLDVDNTPDFAKKRMPGIEKHVIRADSARPETISYCQRHGLPRMASVKKWQGSVEDGITHLKSYDRIVIHPEAKGTKYEARTYRYKVNKAGDILTDLESGNDHHWDAGRYALQPLIKVEAEPRVRAL